MNDLRREVIRVGKEVKTYKTGTLGQGVDNEAIHVLEERFVV